MGIPQNRTWKGRVFSTMSLDGLIADASGDALWTTRLRDDVQHLGPHGESPALDWSTFFADIDAVMLGRISYERLEHAKRWPFGEVPVYVVSRTFPVGDPRISGVFKRPEDAIVKLNALGVRSAHIDGGRNIQGFLARGLIDEITVRIAPVILGGGIPLLGSIGRKIDLRVTGSDRSDNGFINVTYAVE